MLPRWGETAVGVSKQGFSYWEFSRDIPGVNGIAGDWGVVMAGLI